MIMSTLHIYMTNLINYILSFKLYSVYHIHKKINKKRKTILMLYL